ncbi:hypothetical protein [Nitratireductor luteus]|uniref:COG3904 family protein n=1 Tax=Nitratireductor luteus TaxID=2976980 RepID=UPI00223FDF18|nr:hypothetical protein [Nitratireductor luteus]
MTHSTFDTRPRRSALIRYLERFDDGTLVRWAFVGVLIGSATVLGMDLRELVDRNGGLWPEQSALQRTVTVLPPVVETDSQESAGVDPRKNITTDEDLLRQPLAFSLQPGGVLQVTGSIEPGAARRLGEELEARGEYVTTVSLNSPGGSLDDAIAMARTIRERELATRVDDGAVCASSCPLMLAGGVTRHIGEEAAIGVHQFYAAAGTQIAPEQAMADAQTTTARISRHLDEMGVDPALWLHALVTPPRALYYLSREEMLAYGLATEPQKLALN